ncbi:MAG: hypothetical protein JW774_07615 [Candidatus Aureabacteria bacterium]|nr:hypothetical protein [Candidatus Auribacterota bacterium]
MKKGIVILLIMQLITGTAYVSGSLLAPLSSTRIKARTSTDIYRVLAELLAERAVLQKNAPSTDEYHRVEIDSRFEISIMTVHIHSGRGILAVVYDKVTKTGRNKWYHFEGVDEQYIYTVFNAIRQLLQNRACLEQLRSLDARRKIDFISRNIFRVVNEKDWRLRLSSYGVRPFVAGLSSLLAVGVLFISTQGLTKGLQNDLVTAPLHYSTGGDRESVIERAREILGDPGISDYAILHSALSDLVDEGLSLDEIEDMVSHEFPEEIHRHIMETLENLRQVDASGSADRGEAPAGAGGLLSPSRLTLDGTKRFELVSEIEELSTPDSDELSGSLDRNEDLFRTITSQNMLAGSLAPPAFSLNLTTPEGTRYSSGFGADRTLLPFNRSGASSARTGAWTSFEMSRSLGVFADRLPITMNASVDTGFRVSIHDREIDVHSLVFAVKGVLSIGPVTLYGGTGNRPFSLISNQYRPSAVSNSGFVGVAFDLRKLITPAEQETSGSAKRTASAGVREKSASPKEQPEKGFQSRQRFQAYRSKQEFINEGVRVSFSTDSGISNMSEKAWTRVGREISGLFSIQRTSRLTYRDWLYFVHSFHLREKDRSYRINVIIEQGRIDQIVIEPDQFRDNGTESGYFPDPEAAFYSRQPLEMRLASTAVSA